MEKEDQKPGLRPERQPDCDDLPPSGKRLVRLLMEWENFHKCHPRIAEMHHQIHGMSPCERALKAIDELRRQVPPDNEGQA